MFAIMQLELSHSNFRKLLGYSKRVPTNLGNPRIRISKKQLNNSKIPKILKTSQNYETKFWNIAVPKFHPQIVGKLKKLGMWQVRVAKASRRFWI